jgi:hypothetical protein
MNWTPKINMLAGRKLTLNFKGARTMRTPCGLPDHGRDIGKYEFSDMDKFELHCAKASDTVSAWPAWKQNLLDNSPTRDTPRFVIKDAPRCESFDKLVHDHFDSMWEDRLER